MHGRTGRHFIRATAAALAASTWSVAALAAAVPSGAGQERNITLAGRGTLEGGRGAARDVREVKLTLRDNADFAATIVLRNSTLLLSGTWRRPGVGNVEQVEVRDVGGTAVRGEGTLVFQDRSRTAARRLSLEWMGRDGRYRLEVGTRDADENDRPRGDDWSAGIGEQVYRNIDARAEGDGLTRMSGVRGGAFALVRARVGTGSDVIIDIDRPTRGEIRGRVRRVDGRRVEVGVSAIYGYTASGLITLDFRSAGELATMEGSGSGERGAWTIEFRGRRPPNDPPSGGSGRGRDDDREALLVATERGRGTLTQDVGPSLDIVQARVALRDDRNGRVVLEARRETVTIDGRWTQGNAGRIQFEIRRVNDLDASGRLVIRRDGRSFTVVEGDGRTPRGKFSIVFASR